MVNKPLSFKEWLFNYFAIDYDTVDVTEQTKKIWKYRYERYLKEWEEDKSWKIC